MSQQFIKLPKEILFHPDISPLEMRILSVLIYWGGLNKKEPNHIKYGAEKLGQQIGVGRQACRRALLRLQNLRFIDINHRGNLANESFGISNDIELHLYRGIDFLLNGGSAENTGDLSQNDTGHLYHLNTGDPVSNDTALYLNDTGVYLNDTGLCAIDLNKINLNKIHTRAHVKKAPADVAAGQSKPSQQAGEGLAREVMAEDWAAKDARMSKLLLRIYPEFKAWYALYRNANGGYQINPVSSLIERIMPEKARITSVPAGVAVCSWEETPRIGLTKIL